jgi:hypothetical protein
VLRCDLPTRIVLAALAGLVSAALVLAAAVAAGWGALRVEALDRKSWRRGG